MRTNLKNLLLFLAPALILIMVFLVLPIFASFYISFHEAEANAIINWQNAEFVGFANYKEILFHDKEFYKALRNTLVVVAVAMPLTIFISLGIAMLINSRFTIAKPFFRVGFYLPAITNTIAIAVVWKWLLNGESGLLNYFLSLVGIDGPSWLTNERYAIYTIIALVVWRGLGPNIVLFLASLQSIPKSVLEAAEVDGARGLNRFCQIILPSLAPTMLYISLMILIGYMQLFEEPYMLTEGGPLDETISIVMLIYRNAFVDSNYGYASALSFLLFIGIFTFSLIRLKLSQPKGKG